MPMASLWSVHGPAASLKSSAKVKPDTPATLRISTPSLQRWKSWFARTSSRLARIARPGPDSSPRETSLPTTCATTRTWATTTQTRRPRRCGHLKSRTHESHLSSAEQRISVAGFSVCRAWQFATFRADSRNLRQPERQRTGDLSVLGPHSDQEFQTGDYLTGRTVSPEHQQLLSGCRHLSLRTGHRIPVLQYPPQRH